MIYILGLNMVEFEADLKKRSEGSQRHEEDS